MTLSRLLQQLIPVTQYTPLSNQIELKYSSEIKDCKEHFPGLCQGWLPDLSLATRQDYIISHFLLELDFEGRMLLFHFHIKRCRNQGGKYIKQTGAIIEVTVNCVEVKRADIWRGMTLILGPEQGGVREQPDNEWERFMSATTLRISHIFSGNNLYWNTFLRSH